MADYYMGSMYGNTFGNPLITQKKKPLPYQPQQVGSSIPSYATSVFAQRPPAQPASQPAGKVVLIGGGPTIKAGGKASDFDSRKSQKALGQAQYDSALAQAKYGAEAYGSMRPELDALKQRNIESQIESRTGRDQLAQEKFKYTKAKDAKQWRFKETMALFDRALLPEQKQRAMELDDILPTIPDPQAQQLVLKYADKIIDGKMSVEQVVAMSSGVIEKQDTIRNETIGRSEQSQSDSLIMSRINQSVRMAQTANEAVEKTVKEITYFQGQLTDARAKLAQTKDPKQQSVYKQEIQRYEAELAGRGENVNALKTRAQQAQAQAEKAESLMQYVQLANNTDALAATAPQEQRDTLRKAAAAFRVAADPSTPDDQRNRILAALQQAGLL